MTQAVYGEKLVSVEAPPSEDGTTSKIEYRVWNPFRSKLAAAILGGVDGIHIVPGAKVRRALGGLLTQLVGLCTKSAIRKTLVAYVTECGTRMSGPLAPVT